MAFSEQPAVADYPPGNDPPTYRKKAQAKGIEALAFHGSLGMHIRLLPFWLGIELGFEELLEQDSCAISDWHSSSSCSSFSCSCCCEIVTNSIFYDADLVSARLKLSSATVDAMNIVIG